MKNARRKGPYPLSVHIGLAAAALGAGAERMPAHAGVLTDERLDEGPPPGTDPDGYYASRAQELLRGMLQGISLYREHPYKAPPAARETIWRQGGLTLQVLPGTNFSRERPPVLLVPSMVNRAGILDLMPDCSLMRDLAAAGLCPVLLDWGDPARQDSALDLEAVVLQRLLPAAQFVQVQTGAQAIAALGYCMGGTLLAAAAGLRPDMFDRVVFLAAPWDFHAGSQVMLSRVKFWMPSFVDSLVANGFLPHGWTQTVFASLSPLQTAEKFSRFAAMDQDGREARLFVAVEDWLNDGVDMPGPLARDVMREWFMENRPAQELWMSNGQAVRPGQYKGGAMIVTSTRDKLVEAETALALARTLPQAKIHTPPCGHIGMIAGAKAQQDVWGPIASWLLAR